MGETPGKTILATRLAGALPGGGGGGGSIEIITARNEEPLRGGKKQHFNWNGAHGTLLYRPHAHTSSGRCMLACSCEAAVGYGPGAPCIGAHEGLRQGNTPLWLCKWHRSRRGEQQRPTHYGVGRGGGRQGGAERGAGGREDEHHDKRAEGGRRAGRREGGGGRTRAPTDCANGRKRSASVCHFALPCSPGMEKVATPLPLALRLSMPRPQPRSRNHPPSSHPTLQQHRAALPEACRCQTSSNADPRCKVRKPRARSEIQSKGKAGHTCIAI